ncbi:MAG: GatB/YqeY domain-containing protein [Bacteroidetes bacterium]|nr:GatB/YqeY domain-containing protein [Bacteroidota bacterium]
MSLELKINAAIMEAMKAKTEGRLRALRGIKSAIILAKTEKGATGELTEEKEIQLLQKMHKQRKESYDIYVAQNRADLSEKEKEEMDVIEDFLPKQISEDELESAIKSFIAETGASSIKDMGKVMGLANKNLAGKADGQRIGAMVKKLLGV